MDWIAFGLFLIWIALLCINGNLQRLTIAVRGGGYPPLPDPLPPPPTAPPPPPRHRDPGGA